MPRAESSRARARQAGPTRRPENRTHVDSNSPAYEFRVRVKEVTDPVVERYLVVPRDFSFQRFASVLQVAFGWGPGAGMARFPNAELHHWNFELSANRILRNDKSQRLQTSALWIFKTSEDIGDRAEANDFLHGEFGDLRHSRCSLKEVLDAEIEANATDLKFVFHYSPKDEWEHEIEIVGLAPPTRRLEVESEIDSRTQTFCYGGRGARIAEGCNNAVGEGLAGPRSWQIIKNAFNDEMEDDEESMTLRDWCTNSCANYAGRIGSYRPFDPYQFDTLFVNCHLKRITKRTVN